jgi:hypothetical protein
MAPLGRLLSEGPAVGEIGTVLRDSLGRWHFPLW